MKNYVRIFCETYSGISSGKYIFLKMFMLNYICAHFYMYERISIYFEEELQIGLQICAI